MTKRNAPLGSHLAMLAGWLFADLFMALFVVAMATQSGRAESPVSSPSASPSASRRPTGSPSPTGSLQRCPISYELQPYPINVQVSFDRMLAGDGATERSVLAQVSAEMKKQHLTGQYAGLVLAWGVAPNAGRIQARSAAQEVGELLQDKLPSFAGAKVRSMNLEDPAHSNRLRLDVYFFVKC